MKRLLLSLCIVAAVFTVHTRNLLQTQSPSVSAQRLATAPASARLPNPAPQDPMPESRRWFERVALRSAAMTWQDSSSNNLSPGDSQSAPLPTTHQSSDLSVPSAPEGENWLVVIRWATVHSRPLVSAPTVRYYSVGTELQLIDYRQGWIQVLDPVTSERGWIYARYYLQAIAGPGEGTAAVQALAKPQQKVVNAAKPTPHVRRAKKAGPQLAKRKTGPRPAKKDQQLTASAPRHRYETMASILDRALRP
jgi:hypothetical protein